MLAAEIIAFRMPLDVHPNSFKYKIKDIEEMSLKDREVGQN